MCASPGKFSFNDAQRYNHVKVKVEAYSQYKSNWTFLSLRDGRQKFQSLSHKAAIVSEDTSFPKAKGAEVSRHRATPDLGLFRVDRPFRDTQSVCSWPPLSAPL